MKLRCLAQELVSKTVSGKGRLSFLSPCASRRALEPVSCSRRLLGLPSRGKFWVFLTLNALGSDSASAIQHRTRRNTHGRGFGKDSAHVSTPRSLVSLLFSGQAEEDDLTSQLSGFVG